MSRSTATAEAIAESALHHVLADADLLAALLGATGATPEGLRDSLESAELARACLDIIMEDDARVLGFAHAHDLRPEDVARAHALLAGPGG